MTRAEKAKRIQQILGELFPKPAPALEHTDPFTLLVATLLSAQTTDKKVNQVTPRLFAKAPTPERMRALEVDAIRDIIREVGLAPQKAKALRSMSERLCDVYGGVVPQTFDDLESLAGVGHKTASVVLAQGFSIPTFPVDTHIHRLAARWGLSDGKNVTKTERDLKAVFPESCWIDIHLQIIYFGREYCPALRHDLERCPICSWAASKKRIAEEAQKQKTPKRKGTQRARVS